MTAEKTKEVEKMIAKVEKKKDLTRNQAIDYMLGVATGRLNALWRYDESLPEGKSSKGILAVAGRKKRAPKTPRISVLPDTEQAEKAKPKPVKPKAEKKPKAKASKPKAKAKRKSKAAEEPQHEDLAAE